MQHFDTFPIIYCIRSVVLLIYSFVNYTLIYLILVPNLPPIYTQFCEFIFNIYNGILKNIMYKIKYWFYKTKIKNQRYV